jgi:NADPH:quinone reductase-like Zn-dependent oxidoreductase
MHETAKEHAMADINRFLEEGKLKHRVAKSLSFTDIKKAHELIENANLRGSVVVNIN